MAHIHLNSESPIRYFGDTLQLTNWILDSCATYHMTPDILDLIMVSLVDTDKYIEVSDGHLFTAKQTGEVQVKCVMIMGNPSLIRYTTYY